MKKVAGTVKKTENAQNIGAGINEVTMRIPVNETMLTLKKDNVLAGK